MTRLTRNGFLTLIAAFGLGGATLQLFAQAPAAEKERYVTVTVGDAKVRCKVLLNWNLTTGGQAFQVKAVDSGSMLTIVREGHADPGSREANVRVYQWRDANTPHPSAPVAPPLVTMQPPKDNAPTIIVPNATAPVVNTPMPNLVPAKATVPPLPTIDSPVVPKVNWAELAKPAASPGFAPPETIPAPVAATALPVAAPAPIKSTPTIAVKNVPRLPTIVAETPTQPPVVAAAPVAVPVTPTTPALTLPAAPAADLVAQSAMPEEPKTLRVIETRPPTDNRINVVPPATGPSLEAPAAPQTKRVEPVSTKAEPIVQTATTASPTTVKETRPTPNAEPTIDRTVDILNQAPWAKGNTDLVQPGKLTLETWMGELPPQRERQEPAPIATVAEAPAPRLPSLADTQRPIAVNATPPAELPMPRQVIVNEEPVSLTAPAPAVTTALPTLPTLPNPMEQPVVVPIPTSASTPIVAPTRVVVQTSAPQPAPKPAALPTINPDLLRAPTPATSDVKNVKAAPASTPAPGTWQKKSLFEQLRNKLSWLAPDAADEPLPYIARGQMPDSDPPYVARGQMPAFNSAGERIIEVQEATPMETVPVVQKRPLPVPAYTRSLITVPGVQPTPMIVQAGSGRQMIVEIREAPMAPTPALSRKPAIPSINRTLTLVGAQERAQEEAARAVPQPAGNAYLRPTQAVQFAPTAGSPVRQVVFEIREAPSQPVDPMPVVRKKPLAGFDRTMTLVGAQSVHEEREAQKMATQPQRLPAGLGAQPTYAPQPTAQAALPIVTPPTVANMPTPVGYPVYPVPQPNLMRQPLQEMHNLPPVMIEAPPVVRSRTLTGQPTLVDMLGLNKGDSTSQIAQPVIVRQTPTSPGQPIVAAQSMPMVAASPTNRPNLLDMLGFSGKREAVRTEYVYVNENGQRTVQPGPNAPRPAEYVYATDPTKSPRTVVPPALPPNMPPATPNPRTVTAVPQRLPNAPANEILPQPRVDNVVATPVSVEKVAPPTIVENVPVQPVAPVAAPTVVTPPVSRQPAPIAPIVEKVAPPVIVENLPVQPISPIVAPTPPASRQAAPTPVVDRIAPPVIVENAPVKQAAPIAAPVIVSPATSVPPPPVAINPKWTPEAPKIVKTEPTVAPEVLIMPRPMPVVDNKPIPTGPSATPVALTPAASTSIAPPAPVATAPIVNEIPKAPAAPAPMPRTVTQIAPPPVIASESLPLAPMPTKVVAGPSLECAVCSQASPQIAPPPSSQGLKLGPFAIFGAKPQPPIQQTAMSSPACETCGPPAPYPTTPNPKIAVDPRMVFQNRLKSLLAPPGAPVASPYAMTCTTPQKETIILVSETVDGQPVTPGSPMPYAMSPAATKPRSADLLPPPDKLMTVTVGDQRLGCKVVQSWELPNGGHAYQVKSVDTGEMITVVRDGGSGNGRVVPARVFRWHGAETSPEGAPLPPNAFAKCPPVDLETLKAKTSQGKAAPLMPAPPVAKTAKVEAPPYSQKLAPRPLDPSVAQASYVAITIPANPAMDRPKQIITVPNVNYVALSQLIQAAKDSPLPSQRELAILGLAKYDARMQPQIVDFLGLVAANDPAPAVRASALNVLIRIRAPREAIVGTINTLRGDDDIRVRQAVADATNAFGVERE